MISYDQLWSLIMARYVGNGQVHLNIGNYNPVGHIKYDYV